MFEDIIIDPVAATEPGTSPRSEEPTISSFNKDDFIFLPSFLGIIELLQTGNDQAKIGRAVSDLWDKFDRAQLLLSELPGIQYTKQEQEAILEQEKKLLQLRQQQLANHLNTSPITNSSAEEPSS
jgi:RNA polymerase II transcription mediator complex subunit 9